MRNQIGGPKGSPQGRRQGRRGLYKARSKLTVSPRLKLRNASALAAHRSTASYARPKSMKPVSHHAKHENHSHQQERDKFQILARVKGKKP